PQGSGRSLGVVATYTNCHGLCTREIRPSGYELPRRCPSRFCRRPSLGSARTTGRGHPMGQIAEFVLRHRRWVMVGWLLVVIVGMALVQQTTKRLVVDFSLPG